MLKFKCINAERLRLFNTPMADIGLSIDKVYTGQLVMNKYRLYIAVFNDNDQWCEYEPERFIPHEPSKIIYNNC